MVIICLGLWFSRRQSSWGPIFRLTPPIVQTASSLLSWVLVHSLSHILLCTWLSRFFLTRSLPCLHGIRGALTSPYPLLTRPYPLLCLGIFLYPSPFCWSPLQPCRDPFCMQIYPTNLVFLASRLHVLTSSTSALNLIVKRGPPQGMHFKCSCLLSAFLFHCPTGLSWADWSAPF